LKIGQKSKNAFISNNDNEKMNNNDNCNSNINNDSSNNNNINNDNKHKKSTTIGLPTSNTEEIR
jgi:hypothetical protein